MVKYIEFANVFRGLGPDGKYLIFIADNVLMVEDGSSQGQGGSGSAGGVTIRINDIAVEIATIFFNEATSFVLTPTRI